MNLNMEMKRNMKSTRHREMMMKRDMNINRKVKTKRKVKMKRPIGPRRVNRVDGASKFARRLGVATDVLARVWSRNSTTICVKDVTFFQMSKTAACPGATESGSRCGRPGASWMCSGRPEARFRNLCDRCADQAGEATRHSVVLAALRVIWVGGRDFPVGGGPRL